VSGAGAGLWVTVALSFTATACLISASVAMRRGTASWVTVLALGGGLLLAVYAVAFLARWLTGGTGWWAG